MDKLLGWVKQIFVISILSELVIHILPDEKYEGVVRLLCGCMITAACIMPVLNIINAEYDADIDLFAKTSQISELRSQIRFSGKDSSDVMIEKYIETQQEFVTKKVMEEWLACLDASDFFVTGNIGSLEERLSCKLEGEMEERHYDLSPYNWDYIASQVDSVYRLGKKPR